MNKSEKSSEYVWEKDCIAMCNALGIGVTADNADGAAPEALMRIAAMKHLVTEHAAYGNCDCPVTVVGQSKRCDYCMAVDLSKIIGSWTADDEAWFKDFLYIQYDELPPSQEEKQVLGNREEYVLCNSRSNMNKCGLFQGITFDTHSYASLLWISTGFEQRSLAETNPELKQIIPYIIVVCNNKVLRYRRGKKSGEERLKSKWSVGVGGHINSLDLNYARGLEREVKEEIGIANVKVSKPIAMLNDDTTEVGKVHFGVVHVVSVDGLGPEDLARVTTSEKGVIDEGEFVSIPELTGRPGDFEQYESWSQFCIPRMAEILFIGLFDINEAKAKG